MTQGANSGPSGAQKLYYLTVLLPMWRGQLEKLGDAERDFRNYLLAAECLRAAKGPGADPLRIADFCRKWKIPLTLPVIGPTGLLRKIGKAVGGWPSGAAVFDPTGALSNGVKIIAHMGPLIGKIQMRNALLFAMDLGPGDQGAVMQILETAKTPQTLMQRLQGSKSKLESVWKETVSLAEKMENIRKELGLPESTN